MNLAQNVCLDDIKVMYSFLSSDSLKFFHLDQFLSNYWSYRVIFGTCAKVEKAIAAKRTAFKAWKAGKGTRASYDAAKQNARHAVHHAHQEGLREY